MARMNLVINCKTGEQQIVPFTPEEEAAADAQAAAVPRFPELSRRQVRKAMVYAGISLDAVDIALAAMPDGETKDIATIDWQDAPTYLRSHPLFDDLAPAVGVTPAQLDSLWLWAASLDP